MDWKSFGNARWECRGELTKQELVREAHEELKNHGYSPEEVTVRVEDWCRKLGVANRRLNSWEEVFKANYCFICNKNFLDDSGKHAHEKLNDHIEKRHIKEGTKSQERREEEESLRSKYRTCIEKLKREKQDEFDEDSEESYMKVEEGEYRCRVCGLAFATSLDALERHVE